MKVTIRSAENFGVYSWPLSYSWTTPALFTSTTRWNGIPATIIAQN